MDTVLKKYNVVGDKLFYHRSVRERCAGQSGVEPEVHRQFEVFYLISGKTYYVIDGQTYEPHPGDMILVSPNEMHALHIDGGEVYDRAVLLFDADILGTLLERIGISYDDFFLSKSRGLHVIGKDTVEKYRLGEALLAVMETDGDEQYRKLVTVARLIEFLARLDEMARSDRLIATLPSSEDELVRRAIGYVDEHIGERIRLDEMAGALFVSKSTLCHRFSKYMSISITRYVNVRKMHYASELMRRGLTATEAAARVGFDNYAAFLYNFKHLVGGLPTERHKAIKP